MVHYFYLDFGQEEDYDKEQVYWLFFNFCPHNNVNRINKESIRYPIRLPSIKAVSL